MRRTDFHQQAQASGRHESRHRPVAVLSRLGIHRRGEVKLASKASLELTERGARILVGSTEIGQGTRTMHAQIVADTLGMPYEAVEVHAADTRRVPDSGPTVASRTCMVVGRLLQRAADEMREKLGALTPAAYLREARRRCR